MKKLFLIAVLAIFSFQNSYSQDISFGVTGGLFYGSADLSLFGLSNNQILEFLNVEREDLEVLDGGGFFVGLLADVEVIGDFHVQPELLYANIGGESLFLVPIMAKYYIAESFNLQFGPQLDFVMDIPSIAKDFVDTFGFSLAVGAGFDVTEKIGVQAKYTFGINNRLDKSITDAVPDLLDFLGDTSLKTNILQAGVVYKF